MRLNGTFHVIKPCASLSFIWRTAKAAGSSYAYGYSATSCVDYIQYMDPGGAVYITARDAFVEGMREATKVAFGNASFTCSRIPNDATNDNSRKGNAA